MKLKKSTHNTLESLMHLLSPLQQVILTFSSISYIGLIAGLILYLISLNAIMEELKSDFTSFFLIVLLPPILFESAINMETKSFFKHFGTIVLFAIFGTVIAMLITAFIIFLAGVTHLANKLPIIICFSYSSLISATDPVAVLGLFKELNANQMLYTLIFGESILNDAISLIMFDSTIKIYTTETESMLLEVFNFALIFLASIFIGSVIGIGSAYNIIRKILKRKVADNNDENIDNFQATTFLIAPWVSYLIAEGFEMSGIVSIIFCGIAMARYAIPNLSESGRSVINRFYHAVASNFENLVFLFIGIGVVGFELAWNEMGLGLFLCQFIGIQIGRYLNIKVISTIANQFRTNNKIDQKFILMIWFSGLRGAMAYALSLESVVLFKENSYGRIILTMTLTTVLINV